MGGSGTVDAMEAKMNLLLRQTREISFETAGGDTLEFRFEVFERPHALAEEPRFRLRVWLYELVRLYQPIRRVAGGEYFDASVLVLSDMFVGFECNELAVDGAAEACIAHINERLFRIEE
jgi:hypothetical protein